MEIVYLANCVLPSRSANTIQITNTCEGFATLGHDVTLLVPDRPDLEADVADIYEFYDVDPCFEVQKVPRPDLSSAGTLIVNYRMGKRAARTDPDLVYGRSSVACYVAAAHGAPTVYESHAPVAESRFGRIETWFFEHMIAQPSFEYLTVISDALRDYHAEHYPELSGEIVVARDGAPVVDTDTDPVDLDGDGDLQVGYIGHLYQGRGMDVIGEVATRLPWADFHIIGGDPEDVEHWRDELTGVENVTFYGFLPPSDLDKYRLAFDVQLAPYQWNLETNAGHNTVKWMSPLKIFEYMAAGRAIVASDMPSIREMLVDDYTALLCEPDDIDAWADALRRLHEDAVLRNRLGERAHADFVRNYTYEERAKICLQERPEATRPTQKVEPSVRN